MERSFVNKYGKWIALAVVVLALGLWFYLSNGTENYAEKYEGYDLTVSATEIGRDNTYELYSTSTKHYLPLDSVSTSEGVVFHSVVGQLKDGKVLTGTALPSDPSVVETEDGKPFVRVYNVLSVAKSASATITATVNHSGTYRLHAEYLTTPGFEGTKTIGLTVDGQPVTEYFPLAAGEHTIVLNCPVEAIMFKGLALDGPYRENAPEGTVVEIDMMSVESSEGVTAAAAAGVSKAGEILDEAQMADAAEDSYTRVENAVITQSGSSATWKISVPATGFYNIELSYLTSSSRGVDIERELLINGQLPFDGADTMNFSRLWTDKGTVITDEDGNEIRVDENGNKMRTEDNQGNQIRPAQVEIFGLEQTAWCRDSMGYVTEPYKFYFEAGENTITLNAQSEPMVITSISLKAPSTLGTYEEYLASVQANGEIAQSEAMASVEPIIIEGEDSVRRSSPSLYAKYDRSSPATVPYDVGRTVLNYIGGDAWRDAGQWIEWEFTVPETGWYNITIKGRQTTSRGAVSSRIVYLDDQVLFDGMDNVGFPYSSNWNMNTLTAPVVTTDEKGNEVTSDEVCRFYLEAGKTHTIRLEATLGDMGPILSDMEESIYRLNSMYLEFLKLTGVTPDQYRDYHLLDKFPQVFEEMDRESRRLYKLVDDTVKITGQKTDRIAVAQTLALQLETFVADDAEVTQAFTNFKDNITSLGTSMLNLRQVQLDVDQIIISPDGTEIEKPNENFFAKAWHEIVSCFTSYTVDYNALGDVHTGSDVLEVWIVTGRDQSTVLKTMVDDTFTANTGIPVNVMLVDPNALLNATVAGNGPDVVVSTDSWNPVNYALRGAAEDVTQFNAQFIQEHILDKYDITEGFSVLPWDQVLSEENFYKSAYEAFKFISYDEEGTPHEGIYALPETQLCSIMFYRKDILEKNNLKLPETWDALIAMLPTLQRLNMSVGIPYPDIVAPNLSSFYSMIYQRGGSIYNAEATMTTINSEAAVQAFEMYTSLYNDYGLPLVFDFVSRFRSGEMPIGIFDYTTFNTLNVSAPEIRGLWDIAVMPGTYVTDENGQTVLNHAGHSQGACTMMIATDNVDTKAKAWTFMQWWVSADAQVRFGREIESILGPSSRYATANRNAIEQLAWSEEQLTVIRDQMASAVGFREVAGGYYTTRHLTNAVRKVTNEKSDPRETLLDYARTINEEIVKKRKEFDLPVPQEAIDATKNATPVADPGKEQEEAPPAPGNE